MTNWFQLHDLGSVSFYHCMIIECNWEDHTIDLHQQSYIGTMLVLFQIEESRTVATPLAMMVDRRKPVKKACDLTIYQLMMATLMNTVTATRPNITSAVGDLSCYNHDPSNQHIVALKRLFQYFNSMKDWQLRF
jgi:hypothetical protein